MKKQSDAIIRALDDGLVLRRSSGADADALAEFNARIQTDFGPDHPDERVGAWAYDLLARPHPTFHADDFTIIAEAATGRIVSSMNLISQTWAYEGIPFGVGRPELVGTLPEYRNRGLVRLQFDEVHRWSAERGELVQGITGIPFYYRQFGYEMGLELSGGRLGYADRLPQLKDGEAEPFLLRPATAADIPFLMELDAHAARRSLISCVRDEAIWRYELDGQGPKSEQRREIRVITRPDGEAVGFLIHLWFNWATGLVAQIYELKPGISWLEVTPSVARYLWKTGGEYARIPHQDGSVMERSTYGFWFGSRHPAYEVFDERLPRRRDPYAWYVRVPDLPGFLRHIAPALEQRLAESLIVDYNGEARISFYRSGLRLKLDKGRLSQVEAWKPSPAEQGRAAFPNLTFLQLVFGYRSLAELKKSYADCWTADDEVGLLLETLFPKKSSDFLPIS